MASKQYTDEFKAEAVKQVTERGFAVAEVAKRLGVSSHSLYQWLRKSRSEALAGTPEGSMLPTPKDSAEVKRLTEERDIPKKAAAYFAKGDVPPRLSSEAVWSPILNEKEIGREEALFRRADHRLPTRS